MRFEKWQALGNDYAIFEERELGFELTPERIRLLCAPHTGIGADGILLVGEASKPGAVAEIRIFNPDGSEAELSGNGVRQAVMYLRRSGWVQEDSFTVLTAAGEVRPRIHGDLCSMDIGRARLRSRDDFPSGDDAGRGSLRSAGREFAFQFVQVGNPQCAIELSDELEGLVQVDLDVRRQNSRRIEVEPRPAKGVEPPGEHLGRLVGAQVFELCRGHQKSPLPRASGAIEPSSDIA